ncbi:hypothetical protein HY227_01230 [Candidatus Wolfebacteria bacterium]|nr:hypothetical protein [Candidatus Wolfebacteria bacterium]
MRKILVITSWAPPAVGGPQNLYNLFSQFPDNSYCLLTSYYGIDNYSAQNGTWLKGKYIFYDNPKFIDSPETRSLVSKESRGRHTINELKHLIKRMALLKILLGPALIFSQIFMIIREGIKTIKKEKIEIMVGISDFGQAMISTYFLHKITKKPYYLYLFDIYAGNYYVFPGGILARIFEKPIFEKAEKIIVTNNGTKDFYARKYGEIMGNKIFVAYNSVFSKPYLDQKISKYDPKPPYTIIFTGKVYWAQIGALKNLVKAVNELDMDVKLKIYSPSPKDYLKSIGIEAGDKIEISVAPPQDMPKIQSSADILFLPLSWNTKSPQIIATATPGKLTDYLIAGRPILIHAPKDTALVKYARKKNFAVVVDENSVLKLKEGIKKTLTDVKNSRAIIKNAREAFFENHDAEENAKKFKLLF